MTTRLTEQTIRVLKLRREGLKNKQIAENLGVSEANISQIISRVVKKLVTIQDTLSVMKSMGLMEDDARIELTQSGLEFSKELQRARQMRVQSRKLKVQSISKESIKKIKTEYVDEGQASQIHISNEQLFDAIKNMTQRLDEFSEIIEAGNKTGKYQNERSVQIRKITQKESYIA